MEELLQLVKQYYDLTEQSEEVFKKSMELQMMDISSGEVLTNAPVFISNLLFNLQRVTTITHKDDTSLPTYKFFVKVSTDNPYNSTEYYTSSLIESIVDSFVANGRDEVSIYSIRLSVEDRDVCCYIRMSED